MSQLDTLKLDLTDLCNEKCFFCPYHGIGGEFSEEGKRKKPIRRLPIEIVENMLKELNGSIQRVKLSGSGEATLHPDFCKIVQLINEYGLKSKLITNGTMLPRYGSFISDHIDDIVVSIHGDQNIHNKVVGLSGAYQKAIEGLKLLKSKESRCKNMNIAYVLTYGNLDSVNTVIEISKQINVPIIFYFDFNPQEHPPVDVDRLIDIVRKIRKQECYISPPLEEKDIRRFFSGQSYVLSPYHCEHVRKEVEVTSRGDVYVCRSEIWGNVYDYTITDILRGSMRRNFLQVIEDESVSKAGLSPTRCDRCCYQHPPIPQP